MNIHTAIKNIKWRFSKLLFGQEKHNWHIVLLENKDFKKGYYIPLDEYTAKAPVKSTKCKKAVCLFDGKIKNGGLADRLRGIISIYEICKKTNCEFKIIFNHPFVLSQFLEPNTINWLMEQDDLSFNTKKTDICYIETLAGTQYEAKMQKEWFTKELSKNYSEFHIRTNAFFSYYSNYSELFHELFKISPRLQRQIDVQKEILGVHYLSASFRFLNLLNDFNEPFGRKKVLDENEKKSLVKSNLEQLEILHKKNPNRKILVNSDSTTFLNKAAELDFVYTIPGNITHIDGNNCSDEYLTYEKTFLDFFMIANAERIYLMRTGLMYNSGYPYAASKIYNRPFETIEF